MLDRTVVEKFLDEELDDLKLEIPKDIPKSTLVEVLFALG